MQNPDSLQRVREWVKELNRMGLNKTNLVIAIIGNKIDLLPLNEQKHPQNNTLIQEAIQFTSELQTRNYVMHTVTSAKIDGQGIKELFFNLSKRMVEQAKKRLENRDSRSSILRSRVLKTLSVTDDTTSNNGDLHVEDRYGRTITGTDLKSGTKNQNESSCQCWK